MSKLILKGYHRIAILADDDRPYIDDDRPYLDDNRPYFEKGDDHLMKQKSLLSRVQKLHKSKSKNGARLLEMISSNLHANQKTL